jgi:cytochrome c-type biogenesis protein CcmH
MKHTLNRQLTKMILSLMIVVAMANSAYAQTAPPTTNVTDDQVNNIAHKLYCPVCENITLDVCETAACADWRNEIHIQLEAGRSEEQIITDFVQRFGDRVVGTPQDSVLRALSLVTPWIIIVAVLIVIGRVILSRTRTRNAITSPPVPQPVTGTPSNQKYLDLLEKDLEE